MTWTPSPSTPPRGVRAGAPIDHLRRYPLPSRSEDELRRLAMLIRRRPLPRGKAT